MSDIKNKPTDEELLAYCEARIKITVDHYAFYKKFSNNLTVVTNEIKMLDALKDLVIEKINKKQLITID